ncbi:hypothetical protein BH11PSE7_BH11PSE7_25730 [soil metagenome]
MISLIYVSRARNKLPADLKDILASARRNNPPLGVTGALCLLDGVYLQYLEGETSAVKALYEHIQSDPRHTAIKAVSCASTSKRLFSDWSMALMTWNDQTRAIFRAFSPQANIDLYEIDPANARVIFESFTRTPDWQEV